MNIYTIILPTYNDWKSLSILLTQIEKNLKNTKNIYKILIIDDNSSEKNNHKLNKNKFFKEIKIISLKKNVGSQKAIATGLKFINKYKNNNEDKFIIMDSDGEDDPKKINEIVELIDKNNNTNIITMNRTLRKESFFFSILYEIHLLITFFITFKYIRFGNFSFLSKNVVNEITKKNDLWLAYSATLNKYFDSKSSILAPRKKRISGKSKMSYLSLIMHSLNIQSVYYTNIIIAYLIYSIILFLISSSFILIFILVFLLHIFSILIIRYRSKNNILNYDFCLENINSKSYV